MQNRIATGALGCMLNNKILFKRVFPIDFKLAEIVSNLSKNGSAIVENSKPASSVLPAASIFLVSR